MKKIVVVGLWHQGVVGAACMAEFGYDVIGFDQDAARVEELNRGCAPLFEPGLDDLIKSGIKNKNLKFSSNINDSFVGRSDVMIMFDIPVDDNDNSDLSELYDVVDSIAPILEDETVLYVTAQVAVGTCHEIIKKIKFKNPELKFDLAYSPENLRLGKAIDLFKNPALPVIGADNSYAFERVSDLLSPLNADWNHVNLVTAEMTKHALNAYLALSVTFGNELGNLCDEIGADGHEIARMLKREPRVGRQAMLRPGLGFSGATLARDIQTLRALSSKYNLDSFLLDGVWNSNSRQNGFVIRKIKKVYNSLQDLQVSVLGLTYKPDTSTLRRSASLEIIEAMTAEGAIVSCHDPKADRNELESYSGFNFYEDPYEALKNSKVLILITPWDDYLSLDFTRAKKIMDSNPLVIDTGNIWNSDSLEDLGFLYLDIGKGRKVKGKK